MNQADIIALAKAEIERTNSLGFVALPETKAQIEAINKDKPVWVSGLRTYSKRYKRIYAYLLAVAYRGTWREEFVKVKL